jgi:hypothetical protein
VILPPSLELPTANILENEDNSLPFSTLKTQKTSEDRKKKERANLEEEKRKKRKEDEIAWQKEIKRGQLLRSFKDESCSSLTPTDVEKVLERYCKQQELPNDARCAKFINKTSIGGITAATPTLVATGVEAISGGLGLTTMASLIGSPIILSFSMFGYLATRSKVIKAEQKQLMYNYLKDNDYPRQLQKLRNYTTMLLPNV